jgi:hypothetical protein
MARQWSEGLRAGEESLWETIRDWMVTELQSSSIEFVTSIESMLRLADRALERQQALAEKDHQGTMERWTLIDRHIDAMTSAHERLVGAAVS